MSDQRRLAAIAVADIAGFSEQSMVRPTGTNPTMSALHSGSDYILAT